MLPWARAILFARRHSLPVIAPSWVQPRFGAVIRNEPVKRFYFQEFTNKGYIRGFRRALVLGGFTRVPEVEAEDALLVSPVAKSRVFVFEGLRNYFDDIQGTHQLIGEELSQIVHPAILERVSAETVQPFIAVNVRRGDLTNQRYSMTRLMSEPRYTPDDWFIRAIEATRLDPRWANLPVKIVSDGTPKELGLYEQPGARVASVGSAIGDILMMSKAKLLIASGHSTFSMWASFLGEMPTIYYPGKMQQRVQSAKGDLWETEWTPGESLPSC